MSSEPGPLRLDRTPYLRQVLDDLTDPAVEEVVLMCGTQLGKTTVMLIALAHVISVDPGPVMCVLPTLDTAKRFSRQRVAPLVAANADLAARVASPAARDAGNTLLLKSFAGGLLVIAGANSPAGLASMPARTLLLDEIDDYPEDCGGQGDPVRLVLARQDTFPRRRRVLASSPKRPRGESLIEAAYDRGTACRYEVACPECGHWQALVWAQVREHPSGWPRYECAACKAGIEEHHKTALLAGGRWVPGNPDAAVRSYRLSSLYSPLGWLSWRALWDEWQDATARVDRGDYEALRAFTNTRLAETWSRPAEHLRPDDLRSRAEAYPLRVVPAAALVLVAGVDVQDDRWEIGVWGCSPGGGLWAVDHVVVPGDPGDPEDWARLDAALRVVYPHALGGGLRIESAAVDSGGHYTHDVYRYVRALPSGRKVIAVKGVGHHATPIVGRVSSVDVNWRGGVLKSGLRLWSVGTSQAKDLLYSRIRAGLVHLSAELPEEWYQQITAEHRVPVRTATGVRSRWVLRDLRARNEVLDCAVYALAAAERLGVARWAAGYWRRIEDRLKAQPVTPSSEVPAASRADAPARVSLPRAVMRRRASPARTRR